MQPRPRRRENPARTNWLSLAGLGATRTRTRNVVLPPRGGPRPRSQQSSPCSGGTQARSCRPHRPASWELPGPRRMPGRSHARPRRRGARWLHRRQPSGDTESSPEVITDVARYVALRRSADWRSARTGCVRGLCFPCALRSDPRICALGSGTRSGSRAVPVPFRSARGAQLAHGRGGRDLAAATDASV